MTTNRFKNLVAAIRQKREHFDRFGTFQSVPEIGFAAPPPDLKRLAWVREHVLVCNRCPLQAIREQRAKDEAQNVMRKLPGDGAGRIPDLQDLMAKLEAQGQDPRLAYSRYAKPVPGSGPADARVMVVGEAPGFFEERTSEAHWVSRLGFDPNDPRFPGDSRFGVPFVGRSGRMLDRMLEAVGLQRWEVFVTNAARCRPPDNREPEEVEWRTCSFGNAAEIKHWGAYTLRQVMAVRPWLIIGMGRWAARVLLDRDAPVAALRNQVFDYAFAKAIGFPVKVMITYHPAALLRTRNLMLAINDDEWPVLRAMLRAARERWPEPWPQPPTHHEPTAGLDDPEPEFLEPSADIDSADAS